MKQTEQLTNQDVHYLLGTIDIAEGETGGDYSDLKNKLFALYPVVKKETDDYAVRAQRASDEQASRRLSSVEYVFDELDLDRPILSQLKTLFKKDDIQNVLSAGYSDSICLPADLWKYHLDDMIHAGLTEELRTYLEEESEKKGNGWMKHDTNTDEELWHTLVKILQRVERK